MEFNLAVVHQEVALAVPDRECIVWRDRRHTWAETAERARRFANLLLDHGLGMPGDFAATAPWESAHDHVGLYLYNGPEFLEAYLGTHLARLAPFNVNYRYVAAELASLLDRGRPRVLVFHARLAPSVGAIIDRLPPGLLLVQVPDDSGHELLPGAMDYETALAAASAEPPRTKPSPDDLHIVFTGGTTGLPKGVLWRIGEVLAGPIGMSGRGGDELASIDDVIDLAASRDPLVIMPTPPFIHGAGLWVAMSALASGGTVVIADDVVHFDAAGVVARCEREEVALLSLVGDSMALPVLDVLDRRSHNLALRFLSNTAAPLSARSKLRLKRHMPDLRIIDGLGSSEAGHLGGRDEATSFVLGDDTVVLSGDRSRELLPGEDDVGWLCTTGRHARGYLDDQVATEATFTTYRGRSLVISGDRVRLRADGTAELLGRDSLVINTGGEKVFSEEVEERLRSIDGVADAVVVGRPHDHWGTEVVAVIQLLPGAELADDELRRAAGEHLAGYKLPRAFVRTSLVRRGPNGKVDYAWARELVGSTS